MGKHPHGKTSQQCFRRICFGTIVVSDIYIYIYIYIYINDLPEGVSLLCKVFADDTSAFSKAINKKTWS